MELLTKDLILRPATENDLEEVARMWEYPRTTTAEKAQAALRRMEANHRENKPKSILHLCLAVFERPRPKKIIGWCGLDGKAEKGKTVLFYALEESFRNRGYATQCAGALIRYAFEDMEYDILYGGCAKDNTPSRRVMQKAGMTHCGFYEDGGYLFSISKEEFLRLEKPEDARL